MVVERFPRVLSCIRGFPSPARTTSSRRRGPDATRNRSLGGFTCVDDRTRHPSTSMCASGSRSAIPAAMPCTTHIVWRLVISADACPPVGWRKLTHRDVVPGEGLGRLRGRPLRLGRQRRRGRARTRTGARRGRCLGGQGSGLGSGVRRTARTGREHQQRRCHAHDARDGRASSTPKTTRSGRLEPTQPPGPRDQTRPRICGQTVASGTRGISEVSGPAPARRRPRGPGGSGSPGCRPRTPGPWRPRTRRPSAGRRQR